MSWFQDSRNEKKIDKTGKLLRETRNIYMIDCGVHYMLGHETINRKICPSPLLRDEIPCTNAAILKGSRMSQMAPKCSKLMESLKRGNQNVY